MSTRQEEERNLDIISLAERLLVAKITCQGSLGSAEIKSFYEVAEDFVNYGLQHYPTNLNE